MRIKIFIIISLGYKLKIQIYHFPVHCGPGTSVCFILYCFPVSGDKGVLVHCISGWDRTPMFVSLLRLSLWADGAIHKSLTATEIVYLTLAYDWYLFG